MFAFKKATGEPQRKLGSLRQSTKGDLDMTSMVDVTFLLLIFFMVTAAFQLQKVIAMPRQLTDVGSVKHVEPPEPVPMVEIQIDGSDGTLVTTSEWERETFGKQSLITTLRDAIVTSGSEARLIIEVHDESTLRALVESLDGGTTVGFQKIEISHWAD